MNFRFLYYNWKIFDQKTVGHKQKNKTKKTKVLQKEAIQCHISQSM